ncbi:uncharacterized protein LOC142559349 [Dermacentor variabilis]|uniref:uncharacterized protein LOC142559349 n=1 Tax=Dermacentor variabilis TaxID=34621 RepID=UPI003F5BAD19
MGIHGDMLNRKEEDKEEEPVHSAVGHGVGHVNDAGVDHLSEPDLQPVTGSGGCPPSADATAWSTDLQREMVTLAGILGACLTLAACCRAATTEAEPPRREGSCDETSLAASLRQCDAKFGSTSAQDTGLNAKTACS